ncbi:kinase-like domain-containing protein [Cubamyces lactineus]|nr:kinase-like domain-containing protein [Cubamyces lactineus]
MAPSRRQRLPRRAQSSTPYARDSGFASATQSERQPAPQNPRKRCHILAEVTQAPSLHEALATSHPDWRPRPLRLTDLEVVKTAGAGGWGAVHIARVTRTSDHPLERTGALLAVKSIGKNILRDLERSDLASEREQAAKRKSAEKRILSSLPWSPFVAGLIDAFIDAKNVYLALEFAPSGTLLNQIRQRNGLNERETRFYFANIVLALEFLHTHGVVHCDVKPENMVLGSDGYLMLADFGLGQSWRNTVHWCPMGTLDYLSPELLVGEAVDTPEKRMAIDWWASGISLYEMRTQEHPFVCDNNKERLEKIRHQPVPWPDTLQVSDDFVDIVVRMLDASLESRLGARPVPVGKDGAFINLDIRSHPYMQSVDWDRIEKRVAIAPCVYKPTPNPTRQRHRGPFVKQSKIPGLPVFKPPPRFAFIDLEAIQEEDECPRKKRRMGGEFSMCLSPS